MQLTADNRDGVHSLDIQVSNADERVAMAWLFKLDGKHHTLLSLEREDGWQFMVGGGPSRYIVTLGNGEQNLTLQNLSGDETVMVELCAGGQYGEFPETFCSSREQAAHVLSLFFRGDEKQEQWA